MEDFEENKQPNGEDIEARGSDRVGFEKFLKNFNYEIEVGLHNEAELLAMFRNIERWKRNLANFENVRGEIEPTKRLSKQRMNIEEIMYQMNEPDPDIFKIALDLRLTYLQIRKDFGEFYYNLLLTAAILSTVEAKIDVLFIDQQ